MKHVNKIDGHRVTRPAQNHPNESHWQELRKEVRSIQGGKCATCWGEACDLHHRHYDNWGEEQINDVVFLCRQCHEAITSRIRYARIAHGDMALLEEELAGVVTLERYRPKINEPVVEEASTPTQNNKGGFHKWLNKRGT